MIAREERELRNEEKKERAEQEGARKRARPLAPPPQAGLEEGSMVVEARRDALMRAAEMESDREVRRRRAARFAEGARV